MFNMCTAHAVEIECNNEILFNKSYRNEYVFKNIDKYFYCLRYLV